MATVRILSLSFLICLSFGVKPLSSNADEYVINSETSKTQVVGDFACSTCPGPSKSALELIQDGGEVTAGEVWQFYHGQGIDSLEQLTLCLDVQHGKPNWNRGNSQPEIDH
jgi:hypothetical protein